MERHKCKLCFRVFPNGRSLGGHMKSHLPKFSIPPPKSSSPTTRRRRPDCDPATESSSSISYTEEEEEEEEEDEELEVEQQFVKSGAAGGFVGGCDAVYGLIENPTKSFRVADPNEKQMQIWRRSLGISESPFSFYSWNSIKQTKPAVLTSFA
ncbi:unnamed protein product [Linum trigynum]|uniref:C2H2-type domain-containing protein n=1 Tax=Linum trigynum TaxID=586398 RepID=A0AAV2FT13_9ROSI